MRLFRRNQQKGGGQQRKRMSADSQWLFSQAVVIGGIVFLAIVWLLFSSGCAAIDLVFDTKPTATATPAELVQVTPTSMPQLIVATDVLSIRAGCGTSFQETGWLEEGDTATLVLEGIQVDSYKNEGCGEWSIIQRVLPLRSGIQVGCVCSQFVEKAPNIKR